MYRAILVLLMVFMLAGCATRIATKNPFLTVVWGDAYTLEGETQTNAQGDTVCVSDDCIEVRGGHIGETFAAIITGAFDLVAGLLPRGAAN